MICADFLAEAHVSGVDHKVVLHAVLRTYNRLEPEFQDEFHARIHCMAPSRVTASEPYLLSQKLRLDVLRRGWRCQFCGKMHNLQIHHQLFRSHGGNNSEDNLISLCARCHSTLHKPCFTDSMQRLTNAGDTVG